MPVSFKCKLRDKCFDRATLLNDEIGLPLATIEPNSKVLMMAGIP